MSEEKYYDEGDLSKEETGVESHFFSRGINNKDLNSDKKNPDSAAGGAGKDDENTIFDEHSGRNERAAAAEEAVRNSGEAADEGFDINAKYNTQEFKLTSDDRSKLERISDGGRKAFNGLLNIPKIDRVAARFGMQFDQHFFDKSNKEVEKLSAQVARIDDRIKLFRQRNETAAAAANNSGNNPATKSQLADLLTKARNEKIDELQKERERLMAKISKNEADAKFSEVNRNRYVEWMIRRNNEIIAPLEAKKLKYQEDLRNFDEEQAPLAAHFQHLMVEVEALEKEKINGLKEAEEAGLNKNEVKEIIKEFDDKIKRRRKLLEEWEDIKRERAKMGQKIAAINMEIKKADRRKEYEAIFNKKPLIVTSREAAVREPDGGGQGRETWQEHLAAEQETNPENAAAKFSAGDMIQLWQKHFSEKGDAGFKIYVERALKDGNFALNEGEQLTVAEFKQKIKTYYEEKFSGATALLGNISAAIDGFGENEEELRADLRELEINRQENQEAKKLEIQEAIKGWNNFLIGQFDLEFKNDPGLRRKLIMSPGDFVNKIDVPQNVDGEELKRVIENYYQGNPEIDANMRSRLIREYQNYLNRNAANR